MNTPINYYRYTFTSILGNSSPKILGESSFKIEWSREDEDRLSYTKKALGKITCIGDDFAYFYDLEKSGFRCEYVTINIEQKCAGVYSTIFSGRISMNDGNWNVDRCEVSFKVQEILTDQCLLDNKTIQVNLFEISERNIINIYPQNVTIEKIEYSHSAVGSFGPCVEPYWGGAGTGASNHYASYYHNYVFNEMYGVCFAVTKWARYSVVVACDEDSPGPEWTLIDTDCPGDGKKYVKPVNLYGCTQSVQDDGGLLSGKTEECLIVSEGSGGVLDNGLSLKKVLELLVNKFCPGTTVVSDFFQINPETVSDNNYVTGELSKTNQIYIFQKSDVKRPDAFNNASIANWTFEKCVVAFCTMFNCKWRKTGSIFRIEHISFFSKTAGLDLTASKYKKYVVGMHKYSYTTEKIPSREVFKFMEASEGDFKGSDIVYTGACVSEEGKATVKTYPVDDVTTDVELCFANADSDSNVVEDEGFVIVATQGPSFAIISEDPILSNVEKLNNSLSWAHLHRDYHRHYRPLQFGIMNEEEVEFLSVKPSKKGDTISIPLCCDDVFDPDNTIETMMGIGIVDKAAFSFEGKTLDLDLLYPLADLIVNEAPIANNDIVEVLKNVAEDIDVLANDTDPEGDPIEQVLVVNNPMHGLAVVNPDKTIRYTPTTNYVGPDLFTYQIRDQFNWSEPALVTIEVVPPSISLELVNDNYTTPKNTGLSVIAADGLLDNDTTSAGPLTCTAETKTTASGGMVQIFADGSFTYTPPTGLVGDDSFTYTASNGTDSDTATCFVVITQPCKSMTFEATSGSPSVRYRDCSGVIRNTSVFSSTTICTDGHGVTVSGGGVNLLSETDGDC